MYRTFTQSRASVALLCLLLCASPLMRGSVHWWSQLALAMCAALAVVLAAMSPPALITPCVLGLVGVAIWIVIQVIPLPPLVLRPIAPGADALSKLSLSALGLYQRMRPLSLDPAASLVEVSKAFTCTCAALATVLIVRSRRARDTLWAALALSGAAVAITGLISAAVTLGDGTMPPAPFGNPNHYAGFLNLCAWPALGLAMEAPRSKRPYWLTCFVLVGIGVFLSLSRGGIGAFVAGLVVFLSLHLRGRPDHSSKKWLWLSALAVSAVVGTAALIASARLVGKLSSVPVAQLSAVDKVAIWPTLARLMTRFPLFGIGRGAFSTTYPAFKAYVDRFTWTHAENEWLQIPIEIGVPAAVVLIGTFVWTWIRATRDPHLTSAAIGVLSGMAGLALHNTVDFSLEVLGVALPFAVAAASVSRSDFSWRVGRGPLIAWAGGSAVLSALCLPLGHQHSPESDIAVLAQSRNVTELESAAKDALVWHPVDYLPHAIVGARLSEDDCPRAEPWLSRAAVLNPTAAEPHLYLGSCMARRGMPTGAIQQLRLAYLFGRKDALAVAMGHYRAIDTLLKVVPDLPDSLNDLAARLADQRRWVEAKALFERVWMDYGDLLALARLGDVTLELGDAKEALKWTALLHQKDPQWMSGYVVGSRAFMMIGNLDSATAELVEGLRQLPGNPDLLASYGGLLIQNHQFAQARKVLSGTVVPNPRQSARLHQLISQSLEAEGRIPEAVGEMISARDADPGNPQFRAEAARLIAAVGQLRTGGQSSLTNQGPGGEPATP
jgi:tetratricopeptide (TPR) repeat protein